MEDRIKRMPLVALRNMTVLPGMLIHFDVSRKFNIAALEAAMLDDQKVFLVMQRDPDVEEPKAQDLYEGGTAATVKQIMKLPGNLLRVLVTGVERARLKDMRDGGSYLEGEVIIQVEEENTIIPQEREAMLRSMRDLLQVYLGENGHIGKDTARQLMGIRDIDKLIDQIAIQIPMTLEAKQGILDASDLAERFRQEIGRAHV